MAACLLSLLIHGYFLHGGDNDAWLPFVQHAADPGLYAADPFVAGPLGQLSYHVVLMGHASRLLGTAWAFAAFYLAAHVLLFIAFAHLCESLLDDPVAAMLSVALLALPRPIGGTASVTVEASLIPRHLGECLGVLAMVLSLRKQAIGSGLLLGLVMLLHPLTAIPFLASVLGRVLVVPREWGRALRTGLAAGLAGLPALVPYLSVRSAGGGPRLDPGQWWQAARHATPFAFVGTWSSVQYVYVLVPVALLLLGLACCAATAGRREAWAFLPGAVAFLAAGAGIGEGLRLMPVVALQGGRGLLIVVLLALALGGCALKELVAARSAGSVLAFGALTMALMAGWWGPLLVLLPVAGLLLARTADARRRRLALAAAAVGAIALAGPGRAVVATLADRPDRLLLVAGAALAALALSRVRSLPSFAWPAFALAAGFLLVARSGPARVEWPWQAPALPVSDVARWARENTPAGTRFAVPLQAAGFRALSQRAVMLDRMDEGSSLFSPEYAAEWIERNRRFGPAADAASLAAEVKRGAVDVLILPRDAPPVDLPVVYEDSLFRAHARP